MLGKIRTKNTPPDPGRKWSALFPPDTPPHILLFFFAMAIQLVASAIAGVGFALTVRWYWLGGLFLWMLWFAVMFVIAAPHADNLFNRHRVGLRRGAIIIIISLVVLGIVELGTAIFISPAFERNYTAGDFVTLLEQMRHGFQYNDGTALGQQATENLLSGENPYAHANVIAALLKYNGSYDRVTPLRTGSLIDTFPYPTQDQLQQIWNTAIQNPSQPAPEIESRVCYPAGFFLLPAPFIALGITDIRFVYVIFVFGGLAYATWKTPGKKRLLFIAFAIVSLELWNSLADGETGSVVFPLLLIAWVSLGKNRWLSAATMGLAVATKQTSWFFLPFYLVLLWQKSGMKTLVFTCGVIGTIFIVTNAYFIALDPALWLKSILSPMTEPTFPLGVGIVAVVTGGLVNIQSSLPFTILEAIVFAGAIIWYIRNARRWPYAGPIISILPLFFAWRSLWSYFFYVASIMLTMMLTENEDKPMPLASGTSAAGC